jgi:hypothetical protein
MIRTVLAAATALSLALAPVAFAQDAPKFSVKTSTIGQILDNAEAKAAFTKAFPDVASNDQIEQAREMTLADLQGYAPDYFPAAKVAEFETELAKIK